MVVMCVSTTGLAVLWLTGWLVVLWLAGWLAGCGVHGGPHGDGMVADTLLAPTA